MAIEPAVGDASDIADDIDHLSFDEKGKCKIWPLAVGQRLFMLYR
ncbi:hypothetical protein [Rhodanobacter glycinis]|nr:hypothetical protein [Rhodanobacter glycinis]